MTPLLANAAAAVVVLVCSMASCEPTVSSTVDVRPPCSTSVVLIEHGASTPCDVVPPQRLDVEYGTDVDAAAAALDCASSGGTLDVDADGPLDVRRVCRDVDY